jgi:hypothetical protein
LSEEIMADKAHDYTDPMWERYKHDAIIQQMVANRLPMTKEVYIGLAYPFDDPPRGFDREIPEPLRGKDTTRLDLPR